MQRRTLNPSRYRLALALMTGFVVATAAAETPLMSDEWASRACAAWNDDAVLTGGLAESGWIANDKDRGYKLLQVYRSDCGDSNRVELRIEAQDGRAMCTYGGAVRSDGLDLKVDYVMHAQTRRWNEMGAGEYGPMKGMMLMRLKFAGPKLEAMGNMGPFKNFLLLAGKVPGDSSVCP